MHTSKESYDVYYVRKESYDVYYVRCIHQAFHPNKDMLLYDLVVVYRFNYVKLALPLSPLSSIWK